MTLEFGERCVYCGRPGTTMDHDIPLARDGAHSRGNVVPACVACNCAKKAHTGAEWVVLRLSRGVT